MSSLWLYISYTNEVYEMENNLLKGFKSEI
jgi:hypothetical protein